MFGKKSVSIKIIPDGSSKTYSFRIDALAIKFIFVLAIFLVGTLFFIFFSYSKVKSQASLSKRYYQQNQKLLNKQKKQDSLEQALAQITQKSLAIENILNTFLPGDSLPNLKPVKPNQKIIVTEKELSSYVDKVDSVYKSRKNSEPDQDFTPNIWPAKGLISKPYLSDHQGIDIISNLNQIVVATAKGIVVFSGWKEDLGNTVTIQHGSNFQSFYGHLNRVYVDIGDHIKKGDAIGSMGNTGNSTGPHLHYEIWHNSKPIDPQTYLSQ